MRKILIVIECDSLQTALWEIMKDEYDITLCSNAQEAATLLRQDFDGMIMDLFLPGTDGLTFLENTQTFMPPVILALTRVYSDYILQALADLGVGYVIRVPCPISEIRKRFHDMFLKFGTPNLNSSYADARYHLRRLGISPRWNGFHRMVEILPDFDPNRDPSLFNDFYPDMAKKHSVTTDAIDNSICRAIQRAYSRRKDAVWREYFPDSSCCPTNKEFLSVVADRMKEKDPSR